MTEIPINDTANVPASGKQLVRRLIDEVVNARNPGVLDELADGAVLETARRWIEPFRAAFPDFSMEIVELVAEADKVVAHFRCSGTHRGSWLGHPPTGRRFEDVDEIYIFTVRDGRLRSAVAVEDNLARARQLGMRIGAEERVAPDTEPLACTLEPDRLSQRGDEIRALGRAGLRAVERGERHVTLRFRADPAIREGVERIVALESKCCAFLGFTVANDQHETVVTVAAPDGGEWAAHGLADLFAEDTEVSAKRG
jgi:predicted ester cyclase